MLPYHLIDPVIIDIGPWFTASGETIGPFELRWYSLAYVIGLLVVFLFLRRSYKKGTLLAGPNHIESIMIWGILGMIIGARIVYILLYNFYYYWDFPENILKIWEGGLSFHGAFVGSALAVYLYSRYAKLNFLNITDHIATVVPIGLGLGRIGNFINGELWGRISYVAWAMHFPEAGNMPRHPSQLYESLLEGWLLLFILLIVRTRKPRTGLISALFVVLYGAFRFGVEFFRDPDMQLGFIWNYFSMGQVLCLIMVVFGIGMLYLSLRKPGMQKGLATN